MLASRNEIKQTASGALQATWQKLSQGVRAIPFSASQKTPSLMAVDISSASIKLLELQREGDNYRVEHYAVVPLPAGTMGERNNSPNEKLTVAIERLLKRAKTATRNAVIALPNSAVISKVIEMDAKLSERALETEIFFEAEKHIPHAIDQVNLDYRVIGINANKSDMLDVLIVASLRSNTEQRLERFQQAGVDVKVVDVDAYALERSFQLLQPQLPDAAQQGAVAIIDIGDITTTVSVLQAGNIIYQHEEALGSKQLFDAIGRQYSLSPQEAETLFFSEDFPADYQQQVLVPFCQAVGKQVQRLLQFFFSSSQVESLDHLLLAGGVATIQELVDSLQDTLQIPVSVANPLAGMTINPTLNQQLLVHDAPTLLTASGLALRRFTDA